MEILKKFLLGIRLIIKYIGLALLWLFGVLSAIIIPLSLIVEYITHGMKDTVIMILIIVFSMFFWIVPTKLQLRKLRGISSIAEILIFMALQITYWLLHYKYILETGFAYIVLLNTVIAVFAIIIIIRNTIQYKYQEKKSLKNGN